MSADPLLTLATLRPLGLTFRRALTHRERFLRRFDSRLYATAKRDAMRKVRLP